MEYRGTWTPATLAPAITAVHNTPTNQDPLKYPQPGHRNNINADSHLQQASPKKKRVRP